MVKPALPLRYSGPLLSLALALASQPLHAQQAKPADDDRTESEEAVFIPVEYRPPPWQVSVGVRLTGKAKIKFSGLGSVPASSEPLNNITDKSLRTYDNGFVGKDYSVDSSGNKITATDGLTNFFYYTSSDQIVDDPTISGGKALKFMANRIESQGASATADSGSSIGWDVEISRELGATKRLSWGLLFGAGLSDMKAETKGTVDATLRTITDTYSAGGLALPGSNVTVDGVTSYVYFNGYTSAGNLPLWKYDYDTDKNLIIVYYNPEWRIPEQAPISREETTTTVQVDGRWKVKGAYMTARFGPYVSLKLGEHFAAKASAGLTFTVLGARFLFQEKYLHPILNTYMSIDTNSSANESTVTGTMGYFVSGELDWFLTQRTGMFLGASYEDYVRDLTIKIGEQTANIDVSSGTVFRTGVTTRF